MKKPYNAFLDNATHKISKFEFVNEITKVYDLKEIKIIAILDNTRI